MHNQGQAAGMVVEVTMAEPDRLRIPYEDFQCARFDLVGSYGNGNQYMAFLTGAFPVDWHIGKYSSEYIRTRWDEHKQWYAVLHRFDADGNHLGTEARSGGTTADGEREAIKRADKELTRMLNSLGSRETCDVWVRPFGVEIDGYLFGLIYNCVDAEDPDDPGATVEYVMLEPNGIMFHAPWDSGEYST
jgi:formate hydrogenlyase regulatory protein HycA